MHTCPFHGPYWPTPNLKGCPGCQAEREGRRGWTDDEQRELMELMHLSATGIVGTGRYGRHARKVWAADQYAKQHPGVSSTAAYKELCRQEEWRYR